MTPIIGIMASQNYPRVTNSYESIATVNASGASSVSFSSIASTFKHLQIKAAYSQSATGNTNLRFNADTGSNYTYHQLLGTGAAASAAAGTSQTSAFIAYDNKATSTYPATFILDVLDYQNSNKYKTIRTLAGTEQNSADGLIIFRSNLWLSTSAVTQITIFADSGTLTGSFALYGIKG
jgi:hypothetical protein